MLSSVFFVLLALAGAQNVTVSPTPAAVPLIDHCFMMGSGVGTGVIIDSGVYLDNITHVSYTNFYAEFEVWLTEECHSTVQQFEVVTPIPSTPAGLTTIAKVEGAGITKLSNRTSQQRAALMLEWICPADPVEHDYTVDVTLVPTGFKPVTFSLLKKCLPHVTPSAPPTPAKEAGGWSGAGIFFFIVFILLTLVCVIGCGLNYVQRGKTGWEMIPGAVTLSACLGKCIREPHYTPQQDYDTGDNGGEQYGATYQSDL